ncbi:MAG TPA: enolase C-terminal domain-like protein [Chloroflexota bacterium]|nr:enolase C-terminal domain-like protein [Chloroflexota bacterium]
MKITDLTITLHRWDVPKTTYSDEAGGTKQVGVVTIKTDEGVEGHSFLGSAFQGADEFAGQVLQRLKPLVIGRNPLDIGAIWQDVWSRNRRVSALAICAVDVALWDIAGKVAGLPIHRLIGTCRERVPAYASSHSMASPRAYVDEALSFRERGWQAYKIHPRKDPKQDLAICAAVKEAVGDTMVLMLDSMWAYGYEEALRVGLAIQEMGFFWYEDPLAEDDVYGYVKLKQKLNIPILATEYSPGGLYGYTQWILERATDMLRGDVAVKGGLTPMVKIAHLAEAFRLKCEVHHGGNSLNNVANLHVTMAIPNCDYFEVLLPDEAQKHGLVRDIEVDREGSVHAPTNPGLGYEIDWELIERNKTAVLT